MKKILIPCDFSETSDNALRYGAGMTDYFSGELYLIHVTQYPVINPEVGFAAYTFQDAEKDSLEALRKLAARVKSEFGFKGAIHIFSKMGEISEEIGTYAEAHDIDLVVMGISGHGNAVMKTLVGSAAVSVSRNVACPLIIVPPGTSFRIPNVMLYACEYEEEVRVHPGFDRIKEICTLFNAELHVVHVVKDEKHTDHQAHYMEDKNAASPYRTFIVGEKRASTGLLEFMKEHKTDMVIIEPRKHSWFYDLFHKSVTNEIAFNSPVPVLAMH